MYFVLVYCCVGMQMTSCFGGATPIFGMQKNHTSATYDAIGLGFDIRSFQDFSFPTCKSSKDRIFIDRDAKLHQGIQ